MKSLLANLPGDDETVC